MGLTPSIGYVGFRGLRIQINDLFSNLSENEALVDILDFRLLFSDPE